MNKLTMTRNLRSALIKFRSAGRTETHGLSALIEAEPGAAIERTPSSRIALCDEPDNPDGNRASGIIVEPPPVGPAAAGHAHVASLPVTTLMNLPLSRRGAQRHDGHAVARRPERSVAEDCRFDSQDRYVMKGSTNDSLTPSARLKAIRARGLKIAKKRSMLCAIAAVARKLVAVLHRRWIGGADLMPGVGAKVTPAMRASMRIRRAVSRHTNTRTGFACLERSEGKCSKSLLDDVGMGNKGHGNLFT